MLKNLMEHVPHIYCKQREGYNKLNKIGFANLFDPADLAESLLISPYICVHNYFYCLCPPPTK